MRRAARPDRACPRPTRALTQETQIKRVVGLPGERVKVLDGIVYLNRRRLHEPYARPDRACALCRLPREIRVPPRHFFVVGDNRGESSDSRDWGPVSATALIGRVTLRYWPPSRFGGI